MIVADASAVLDLLLGPGSPAGEALAARFGTGDVVCAPHLIDAEVGQGLRRYALRGDVAGAEAMSMIADFLDLPIIRYPHGPFLGRAFALRQNATMYDGLYLALAEALECPLVTGDKALAGVPGSTASVEIYPATP